MVMKMFLVFALRALAFASTLICSNQLYASPTYVTWNITGFVEAHIVFLAEVFEDPITSTVTSAQAYDVDASKSWIFLSEELFTVTGIDPLYAYASNALFLDYAGVSITTSGPQEGVLVNFYNNNFFNQDGQVSSLTSSFAARYTNSLIDPLGLASTPLDVFIYSFRGSGIGIVPEPASWALMVVGFGMISVANRNRSKQQVTA
jgi:hypothetical protein